MSHESENTVTLTWSIENYSYCNLGFQESLESPEFIVESLGSCILQFYPRGGRIFRESSYSEYVSCELYTDSSEVLEGTVMRDCLLELISPNEEILSSEKKILDVTQDCAFKWENAMESNSLINEMKNWSEDTLTIRCRLIGKQQIRTPDVECEVRTKIGFDLCSSIWNVSYPHTSDWFERRVFAFSEQTPIEVTLSAPEDDVIINIKNEKELSSYVICKMSLADVSGNEQYSQSAKYLFSGFREDVWKFPTFFTKTILEDQEDTILEKGKFFLICSLSVTNRISSEEVRYRTLPLVNLPHTEDTVLSLQSDLSDLFTSKKHTDVKLRVDNDIFPAHKGLLAVRSPVFSAMFDQDILDNQTGIVDIDDMDVKTINSFLEFLYTGKVGDMDYENASKLLTAAEKYQVLSLKEKCASFFMLILSDENVCQILALADMVGHKLLKTSSMDYIKSHSGNILRSPQWSEWIEKNVKLSTEIFCVLSIDIASGK